MRPPPPTGSDRMAERVYLHVGAPKTGTSYLQRILWANKGRLLEQGYLLPGRRHSHYEAMGDLRRGLWFDPDARWTWQRLSAAARNFPGTVIISEEMLGAASREQATRALMSLRPADLHVIVACRDLWRSIPSTWQQGIRTRSIGSFESYLAALRNGDNPGFWANQWPVPIMERWCQEIPPENRHVITLPPAGSDPILLWKRFAGVLGLDPEALETDFPVGNVSMGAHETELLRLVNCELGDRFPLRTPYLAVVRRFLTQPVLMTRGSPEKFGAPPEWAAWAAEKSASLIAELAAYECDLVGDLADLTPRVPPTATSPDDLAADELLQTAVEVVVGMLEQVDHTVQDLESNLLAARAQVERLRSDRRQARKKIRQLQHRLAESERTRKRGFGAFVSRAVGLRRRCQSR